MLLDPFLYDFVADRQRALREAAERAARGGAGGLCWCRLPLGLSAAVTRLLVRRRRTTTAASGKARPVSPGARW
jgi:hypothetical protein